MLYNLGMDPGQDKFFDARRTMVREQLRKRGIHDRRVLDACARVRRDRFVAAGTEQEAYSDRALAIGCDQTISQPYIVALMTEALQLAGDERTLEVGTGSGYQTAVLAELAGSVYTIERHEPLAEQAQQRLSELGYRNIRFRVGDGSLGWPGEAPFDRIIVTAAAVECPPALWEQLAENGILVGPFGDPEGQVLQAILKLEGRPQVQNLTGCRFVPLVSSSN